jgi:hypothetical protein
MNQANPQALGGFEQRLLRELRQVVAEGPRVSSVSERAGAPRRFGRVLPLPLTRSVAAVLAVGSVAAALAIAIVGLPFGGGDESKAWAVDHNPNGTVTVRIDALSDAAGLQRKLSEAGIPALVQYLPPGKTCAGDQSLPPGAVTQGSGDDGLLQSRSEPGGPATQTDGQPVLRRAPQDAKANGIKELKETTASKRLSDGGIEFTLDANRRPGETLVIRNQNLAPRQVPANGVALAAPRQGPSAGGSAMEVAFVAGKPHPCKVVDSPAR